MSPASTPSLAALADGASRLYSLPSVAVEVVRLTDQPKVNARAICDCLEGDPALAAKVLRVVNSSLYGLPRQIGSLPEAIALLGVRPLKLLTLGFALPKQLFEGVTGGALRRYWTETLTTATAARELAQAGWGRLGDEALIAGLMQGVGQLALVGQLGEDYARLLELTARRPPYPAQSVLPLERRALGFEHPQLSAALVRRWRLPERLAVAVEHQSVGDLSRLEGDHACLAQSLRLANLLSRLVTGGDFSTLPALVDESDRYAAITKRQINAVVDTLQEKVAQLADAMSVEVASEVNYQSTLVEAHAQLSIMAERTAAELMREPRSGDELDEDDRLAQKLLTETRRLSAAARVFLSGGTGPRTDEPVSETPGPRASHHATQPPQNRERLLETVRETAAGCRSRRESLSLAMVRLFEASDSAAADAVAFRDWFDRSPLASELADARWVVTARDRVAVLTPGLDRVDAARSWSAIAGALLEATPIGMHVGVAGLGVVPKGFDAERLVEPAERCLAAAAAAVAGPAIKSIEVF